MSTATETPAGLIRGIFGRHKGVIALGYLLAIGHQVSEALVPVVSGVVIGRAVATGDVTAILLGVVTILVLFAVLASSAAVGYYLLGKTAVAEAHRLRVRAVRRILTDPTSTRRRQPGELLSITSSDTQATTQMIEAVGGLVASSVGLLVATVVLLRIDLTLGLGLLVAVGILVAVVQLLGPYLERRLSARQEAVGLAASVASDLLTGLRSLRGFGGVAEAILRYRKASRTSLSATIAATSSTAVVTGVGALATGALVVLTAAVAARYALAGSITLAELVTVVGMAAFLLDPVSHVTRCVRDLAITRASSKRVAELLIMDDSTSPTSSNAPQALSASDSRLQLVGVTDGATAPIDLAVAPGELLGIVVTDLARTESLAAMIGGAQPAAGAVRLGSTDVAAVPDAELRTTMLLEPHTVHLLGGTLAEALDTGPGGRGDVDLSTALRAASVQIEDLAGHGAESVGLDQIGLNDHGTNLSGGQRQRIALARAFSADRDILVLRDPTSAVDAVTEDAIATGLRDLRAGRRQTVVFTTSPLILNRCDRVLFVGDDGESTIGSHSELSELEIYRTAVLR